MTKEMAEIMNTGSTIESNSPYTINITNIAGNVGYEIHDMVKDEIVMQGDGFDSEKDMLKYLGVLNDALHCILG